MSAPLEDLREAHDNAAILVSEKYRKYLFVSGRLLPVLLGRFRDDMAEALGEPPPEIPRRDGQVRPASLSDLTSSEFEELCGAVADLVARSTRLMEDPVLPDLLRDLLNKLSAELAEREAIAAAITEKAKAS
jgi:hypothetical protein